MASFGEIHPKILSKLNIPSCVGFEIYLDEMLKVIDTQNDNKEFTFYNLQAVKRDFSFDVPININSSTLIDKIQQVGFDFDGIIINAAAYTHTSVGIGDAIRSISSCVSKVSRQHRLPKRVTINCCF